MLSIELTYGRSGNENNNDGSFGFTARSCDSRNYRPNHLAFPQDRWSTSKYFDFDHGVGKVGMAEVAAWVSVTAVDGISATGGGGWTGATGVA